jgi:4-diphosphocytidyl-2-C-methyl-D-erythritol kinase
MTSWIGDRSALNAPAKINLCLRIVGRRDDGYHLLDSLVAPVSLFDDLSVRVEPHTQTEIALRCEPAGSAPAGSDNLAVRAAEAFLQKAGLSARVSVALRKRIPAGAGLGGGSSDAAAVLRCLNALLSRPLERDDLAACALLLGADVPLFLVGAPARMRGIGEVLEPWSDAPQTPIVIAFAGAALDTRAVYAKYDDLLTMSRSPSSIRALTPGQEPLGTVLHNDLEAAAFHVQPGLHALKKRLRSLGAESVLMTGSGSAMFGCWQRWDDAHAAAEQLRTAGLWARVVHVLERVPAVELVAR